ncbi:hypothetical protein BDN70DRAFT_997033 [Pholiota conissans]|uniref:Uncharacterized protein n=1 Tax=Pholiota conissans TaxID=109636 RepID=A0A9P5YTJ6_9AGAR|nr:hypothetical protein BDN70DRAFT_997033 [Pholiota conissans]
MSVASFLPTTFPLNAESAINDILTDIPLFCEGVMGIGVFTFLFLTKQVNLLSVFLYMSSFCVFTAATLDLSQVIIRGPQNSSKITISLDSISGFLYAREVFLSLSILSLDLFFWQLVSRCPAGERNTRTNEFATSKISRLESMHSASWSRWGIIGTILKYSSLAAVFSVPLLSMLWRLMPTQRKYGSIYVIEATVQTSIMAIFILKLLLNVSISPLDTSWRALQAYIVPITSLLIGLALGISNIIIFAFTEMVLGRFLLAVQVYLLFVHSLFTTFEDFKWTVVVQTNPRIKTMPEKSTYIDALPLAYSDDKRNPSPSSLYPMPPSRQTRFTPQQSVLSRSLPSPREYTSSELQHPWRHDETTLTAKAISITSHSEDNDFLNLSESPKIEGSTKKSLEGKPQEDNERPVTTMSLSYYAMNYDPSGVEKSNIAETFNSRQSSIAVLEPPDRRIISASTSRPSSLDEILRQQNELDKSIAALRLVSMSISSDSPFENSSFPSAPPTNQKLAVKDQPRNTLVSRRTESLSNRSDFSLSVFPAPPAIPSTENLVETHRDQHGMGRETIKRHASLNIGVEDPQSSQIDPPGIQYDVTSFIGDLSEPSRSSQVITLSEDFDNEEITSIISAAHTSSVNGLRPMILASLVLASPSSPNTIPTQLNHNLDRAAPSNAASEAGVPLRPFLLGNPSAQMVSQRVALTKVPLAQRRQRGGTISSSTRWPVISNPKMTQDRNEVIPGAFERPRPPPRRLSNDSTP